MNLKLRNFRSALPVRRDGVHKSERGDRARFGMTLVELMLVVAIIVVIAALAAPSAQRSFSRQALQKGADRVRVAMGQARVKSIRAGEEYCVFYSPNGSWFNIAPFTDFQEQAAIAVRRERIVENGAYTNFEPDLLPKGVRFAGSRNGENSRDVSVLSSGEADGSVGMILFYPDGTSQDAKIVVESENQMLIQIQLRGLTGIARTVRIDDPSSL